MTLFINIRPKCGDVTAECIPQRILILCAKVLGANAIHCEMRPVYGDKCFARPAIRVWCKKFAHGPEIVDKE